MTRTLKPVISDISAQFNDGWRHSICIGFNVHYADGSSRFFGKEEIDGDDPSWLSVLRSLEKGEKVSGETS